MAKRQSDTRPITIQMIQAAQQRLKSAFGFSATPLQLNAALSEKFGASIYFKREDALVQGPWRR